VATDAVLSRGRSISLELDSGPPIPIDLPKLAIVPVLASEIPVDTQPAPQAWGAFAGIARAGDPSSKPFASVIQAQRWIVRILPTYAPIEDDEPAGEEQTPVAEVLNRGITASASEREREMEKLFGTKQPFTVSWSFQATNLTTGRPTRVRDTERADSADVEVTYAGRFTKHELHVRFPSPAEGVYLVEAIGTVTDVYGMRGTFHQTIWSHYLTGPKDSLAAAVLNIALRMVGKTQNSLNPDVPRGVTGPSLRSPNDVLIEVARSRAIDAARDGRVTPDELEQLVTLVRAFESRR
jgi:hypothetical protein